LRLTGNNSVVQGLIIIGFNGDAIEVTGNNNVIHGNFLGVVPAGSTMPSGNTGHGVHINNASFNLIGGATAAAMNLIGNNSGDGVFIPSGSNNTVRGNSIIYNGGQAIDLGLNGVTPNDFNDADSGANFQQNFPVITSATLTTTGLVVTGTINSRPSRTYDLEFSFSPACDSFINNGEAQFPIGRFPVAGDFNGDGQFEVVFAVQTPRGVITATATDPAGNTSESSACRSIISTVPPLNLTITSAADSGPGTLRNVITIANNTFSAQSHNITFNIPGGGVQIISPTTPLPAINSPLNLNGYSQPGASPNTLLDGNDADILIRLDGANCGPTFGGLVFNSSGNIVRGLSFTGWRGNGLVITGGSGHQVTGCYFGLCPDDTPTGQFRAAGDELARCDGCGNSGDGVRAVDVADSTFGGDEPAEHCLSGCNGQNGLTLNGPACLRNMVQNFSSGIDPSGTECRGNGGSGFVVNGGASENLFKDCQSGCNHVNGYHHADLNTRANALRDCTAGTDSLKRYDLGNGDCGARWDGGAFQSSADGCTFGYNGADGICGVGLVHGGGFCCNTGDSINNALDGPRVISATATNGETQVTVEITGAAGFPVEVEFYSAPACPCSNETGGSVGRFRITPTATGVSRHTITLPRQLSNGTQLQATVTETVFTSRFGTAATVTGPTGAADLALSMAVVGAPGSSCTTQTVTLVVTNQGPDAANGVVVDTDVVHISAEILSASTSQGSCSVQNQKVVCNLGGMPSGGTTTISIQFKVPSSFGSTRVESRVTSGGPPDPVPQNNQAAGGIEQIADVGVRFSSESVRVASGEQVTLTARVVNSGPCVAENVKAEIPLSPPLRILSMTASQGSCDASTGKCALGELTAGAEATITIVAIADGMVPIRSEGATVGTTTRDPNDVNNFDGVLVSGVQRGSLQARQGGGGEFVLEWQGDGKLQSASNLNNAATTWTDVPGNPTSPYLFTPSGNLRFFRLEWEAPPFLDLPRLAIFQDDEELDGVTRTNLENGSVDVTFIGVSDPTNALYFSLALDGQTQISNAPVFSLYGTNPQTMTFTIRITEPDMARDFVPISWLLSTNVVFPLVFDETNAEPVFFRTIKGAAGTQGELLADTVPTNFFGPNVRNVAVAGPTFPNRDVGLQECVPGAIANSLEYLNGRFGLGMNPADIDIEPMKMACGWTTNGAPTATWPDLKAQYMTQHGLPIVTERTTNAALALAALREGYDVEISFVGHVAALVGIADYVGQPGLYTIVVKHDICQGEPGGRVTQTGTLDTITRGVTGVTWGREFLEFVIERPGP
jgi:hypothetical protein